VLSGSQQLLVPSIGESHRRVSPLHPSGPPPPTPVTPLHPLRLAHAPLTCVVLDAHLPACHLSGLVGSGRGSRSSRIGPYVAGVSAASTAVPPTVRRRPPPIAQVSHGALIAIASVFSVYCCLPSFRTFYHPMLSIRAYPYNNKINESNKYCRVRKIAAPRQRRTTSPSGADAKPHSCPTPADVPLLLFRC